MKQPRFNFLLIFSVIATFNQARTEIFTSAIEQCHVLTFELNKLFYFKNLVIQNDYGDKLYSLIKQIRRELPGYYFYRPIYYMDECLDESSQLSRFITNPVNAYMLIYRNVYTWPQVDRILDSKNTTRTFDYAQYYNISETDVQGALEAFYRLQTYYGFKPRHLRDGILSFQSKNKAENWTIVPKYLTPDDLYEIGKIAYQAEDYTSSQAWLTTAYNDAKSHVPKLKNDLIVNILDYLSWSEYNSQQYTLAYEHIQKIEELKPGLDWVKKNFDTFGKATLKGGNEWSKIDEDIALDYFEDERAMKELRKLFNNYSTIWFDHEQESVVAKLICRKGTIWVNEPKTLDPHCFVKTGTNLFGKFIRVNIEKIYSDPDFYIFKNFANNADILKMKTMSRHSLDTAKVLNRQTGEIEPSKFRVTETSWHALDSDPSIKKMLTKLRVATGLTLTSAEDVQFANYGIGGYYNFHYDFWHGRDVSINDTITREKGNRLATFTLYMSDVAVGGKTGFPRLGLSIQPSKGDAIFWYNLFSDETGDARRRYLSCPVALGEKWTASIWIRMKGEEITKPCGLTQQKGI